MREHLALLAQQGEAKRLGTSGVLVHPDHETPHSCPRCRGAMNVRKTTRHYGKTIAHGDFCALETVYVCSNGCTRRATTAQGGRKSIPIIQRSQELARLLIPRRSIGYDVMGHIGLERSLHQRQREEIQIELERKHGISLSTGEISILARDFLTYLEALHRHRAPALRKVLQQDGGWPMHSDATGEGGRGTMFAVYAGWRGWILGSWKIPTERADTTLPRLLEVAELFGAPCAIMRDLGRAMIEASLDFVTKLGLSIPILGCHFHFLKDVGKDLLEDGHDQLRALFRRFNVRAQLRAIARDLGRSLGTDIDEARAQVERWLVEDGQGHR